MHIFASSDARNSTSAARPRAGCARRGTGPRRSPPRLRGVPFFLARRLHIAGHDSVHADILAAQIAREAAGQPLDRGLAGLVEDQVVQTQMPADRPEVQDRAAPARFIAGITACAQELVTQIDVQPLVPIGRGDLVDAVAIVISRIVDEDIDPAQRASSRRRSPSGCRYRSGRSGAGSAHGARRGQPVDESAGPRPRQCRPKATRAPCATNASTSPSPIPEPPPVTMTRLSIRLGLARDHVGRGAGLLQHGSLRHNRPRLARLRIRSPSRRSRQGHRPRSSRIDQRAEARIRR